MKAISIRQPWAWLIAHGYKDIENRNWRTKYRGPVLIHAATRLADAASYAHALRLCERLGIELPETVTTGGVIGVVDLCDCVQHSDSPWFAGPFGFVLRDPRTVEPFNARGRPGLFTVADTLIPPLP